MLGDPVAGIHDGGVVEAAEALADIRQGSVGHPAGEKHRHLTRARDGVTAGALQQLLRLMLKCRATTFCTSCTVMRFSAASDNFVLQSIGGGFKRHFVPSGNFPFDQQLADRAVKFAAGHMHALGDEIKRVGCNANPGDDDSVMTRRAYRECAAATQPSGS